MALQPLALFSGEVIVDRTVPPATPEKWWAADLDFERLTPFLDRRGLIMRGGMVILSEDATVLDHIRVGNLRVIWPLTLAQLSPLGGFQRWSAKSE